MTATQNRKLELLETKRSLTDRPEPTIAIHVDVVDGCPVPAEIVHWNDAARDEQGDH
jgi:hypothetical protein